MKSKILIVEDEILIADTIKRYLTRMDYDATAIAISYEEALEHLKVTTFDLVLLDIRLNGFKTGIDVATYINEHKGIPFIYLTSQLDPDTLLNAKNTFPAGYLSKPIQKESLYATIEIALFNHQAQKRNSKSLPTITLTSGSENYRIALDDIMYIQADHVYSNIFLVSSDRLLLVRKSLKQLKQELPSSTFLQPHRSYLVNTNHISNWDKNSITIGDTSIAISRNNKEAILAFLKKS